MGNGTVDVGRIRPKPDNAPIRTAMAEQRRVDGGGAHESTPQKFVHLVGCRDPNARKTPWTRPRPPPPKS